MNSKGVFEVLNRLDTVGLEWWLDGGWGVDARGDGWQPALKGEPFRWPAEALCADDARVLCERFGLELPPAHARPPGFIHPRRALGRPR